MTMLKWTMAVAVLAMPAAAGAQSVKIARGETVTLIMGDDDALHATEITKTDATAYEASATAEFRRGDYDAALGANSLPMAADSRAGALAPRPARGKVVLRFVRSPGKDDSLLSIQNGLGVAVAYRATMTIDGKSQPTDVCIVPPGRLGNEYWPHPIDSLDLANFRLVPWSEGDGVKCE
jgi:hypothetical protein